MTTPPPRSPSVPKCADAGVPVAAAPGLRRRMGLRTSNLRETGWISPCSPLRGVDGLETTCPQVIDFDTITSGLFGFDAIRSLLSRQNLRETFGTVCANLAS